MPRSSTVIAVATAVALVSSIAGVLWTGIPHRAAPTPTGAGLYTGDERLRECRDAVPFPVESSAPCEGHWRAAEEPPSRLRWPERRPGPFCGQRLWTKRLEYVEARAAEDEEAALRGAAPTSAVAVERQRGLATSRIDGTALGNVEYRDTDRGLLLPDKGRERARFMCWTGDLRAHYMERYNVVPSGEFYHYVLLKYQILTDDLDA